MILRPEELKSDLFPASRVGKMGAINKNGKVVIPFVFDSVNDFSEGFAAVMIGEKYGFIDISGKLVIQTTFDSASPFSNQRARVEIRSVASYIDTKGRTIAAEFSECDDFSCGLAIVKPRGSLLWGAIDPDGTMVIEPQFDEVLPFSEGLAAVRRDSKWGYIDHEGKFRLPPCYSGAFPFSEGLAAVAFDRLAKKFGFIDHDGRPLLEAKFNGVDLCFAEGFAPVWQKGKFGFIDKLGNLAIPYQFYDAEPFSEGLACVGIKSGRSVRYGYITTDGVFSIRPQFFLADTFRNGLARVCLSEEADDEAWGYIDHSGQFIWKPNI